MPEIAIKKKEDWSHRNRIRSNGVEQEQLNARPRSKLVE
jgi:hypothetical protein